MNSKTVLSKIMSILNLQEEVLFTYAKLKDGTIVESKTFDVGEAIEVVAEDGTKTPAPDGEHELSLKDETGKENLIKVIVKDGLITERENVELPEADTEAKGEVAMDSMAGDDIASPIAPDAEDESTHPIPQTMEALSYRIEELAAAIAKMQAINEKLIEVAPKPVIDFLVAENLIDSTKPAEKIKTEPLPGYPGTEKFAAVDGEDSVEADDEELPKLDGAPIEDEPKPTHKFSDKKGAVPNSQNTFLSKLYK